ncbi:hypothetical protein NMY22_g15653 [Coprinellus aureogranulatus]|nr:hypothetical protein NMY22_g15653 [Coprinellus aureogranulatus]
MSAPPPPPTQDPVLPWASKCSRCPLPMSAYRVYEGKGDSSLRHLRGSIVQSCIDRVNCRTQAWHTEPLVYEDAVAFVARLNNPALGNVGIRRPAFPSIAQYPPGGLPAGQPPAIPAQLPHLSFTNNPPGAHTSAPQCVQASVTIPPSTAPSASSISQVPSSITTTLSASQPASRNNIACQKPGGCFTHRGTPKAGHVNCVDKYCKPCCLKATDRAKKEGYARDGFINASTNNSTSRARSSPTTYTVNCPGTAYFDSTTHGHRNRHYARREEPCQSMRMLSARDGAHQEREIVKSGKITQQELEQIKRRTVQLVIWRMRNQQPLRLKQEVKAWPNFLFTTFPVLLAQLGLDENSFIDVYLHTGYWSTMTVGTVITLERGYDLLVRLRPSLGEELALGDCLGIDDELEYQPRSCGSKRSAYNLVSPLKKTPRIEGVAIDVSATANRPPPSPLSSAKDEAQSPTQVEHAVESAVATTAGSAPPNALESSQAQQPLKLTHRRRPIESTVAYRLHHVKELKDKGVDIKDSFTKVFDGAPYARTTVKTFRDMWDQAPSAIRQKYLDYGRNAAGLFSNFIAEMNPKKVRGKKARLVLEEDDDDDDDGHLIKMEEQEEVPLDLNTRQPIASTSQGPVESTTRHMQPLSPIPSETIPNKGKRPGDPGAVDTPNKGKLPGEPAVDDFNLVDESLGNLGEHPSGAELCPFCDKPLPSNPSPVLLAALEKLIKVSIPHPVPMNLGHRRAASFQVHIEFCNQHSTEVNDAPKAESQNWPMTVDFNSLPQRIKEIERNWRPSWENRKRVIFLNSLVIQGFRARAQGIEVQG